VGRPVAVRLALRDRDRQPHDGSGRRRHRRPGPGTATPRGELRQRALRERRPEGFGPPRGAPPGLRLYLLGARPGVEAEVGAAIRASARQCGSTVRLVTMCQERRTT